MRPVKVRGTRLSRFSTVTVRTGRGVGAASFSASLPHPASISEDTAAKSMNVNVFRGVAWLPRMTISLSNSQ
jgi:hypothetical protein